jgi:hypothetical protein
VICTAALAGSATIDTHHGPAEAGLRHPRAQTLRIVAAFANGDCLMSPTSLLTVPLVLLRQEALARADRPSGERAERSAGLATVIVALVCAVLAGMMG